MLAKRTRAIHPPKERGTKERNEGWTGDRLVIRSSPPACAGAAMCNHFRKDQKRCRVASMMPSHLSALECRQNHRDERDQEEDGTD